MTATAAQPELMGPRREHQTAVQRLNGIARDLEAAYAERGKHPVLSPAWNAADDAVDAVYADLRAFQREVWGR